MMSPFFFPFSFYEYSAVCTRCHTNPTGTVKHHFCARMEKRKKKQGKKEKNIHEKNVGEG